MVRRLKDCLSHWRKIPAAYSAPDPETVPHIPDIADRLNVRRKGMVSRSNNVTPKLIFHFLYEPAQGGLGDIKNLSRFGKTMILSNGFNIFAKTAGQSYRRLPPVRT